MTTRPKPEIDCERFHASLRVRDLAAGIAFYTEKLGFELGFTWGDPPTFAGVNLDDIQIFLEEAEPEPGGGALYFAVGDADELFEFHRANGVDVVAEPEDHPYGIRGYTIRDLHGHLLHFGHYIYHVGPPVEIERVDVPVRLEKRLAALLHDLAEHKGLSLSGCLEEILLHTCEPLGDGVASPHTRRQLRHIQTLKEKHGIDYDTHASYRFVEKRS